MRSAECGVWSVEGKAINVWQRSKSAFPFPPSALRLRSGVTLIELLVVILIISILAALVLGVASLAGETAREQHSKHVVERLHTLLTDYYGTYKTRRVKLRQQVVQGINNNVPRPADRGKALAEARLNALRELMMMEVPDRWSDVLLFPVPADPSAGVSGGVVSYARYPYFEDPAGNQAGFGRSQLAGLYLRKYADIATRTNTITGNKNTGEDLTDNQGAECLYMIIMNATGDGEAPTLFGENCIGDVDGDGAPEFVDGWKHPINFLRWAPGFDSQIQLNANTLVAPTSSTWLSEAAKDHDPFDVFRVDQSSFRLIPLIYSAGRDETFGIRLVKPHVVLTGLQLSDLSQAPDPTTWPNIKPWALVNDPDPNAASTTVYLGTGDAEGTSTDNVHNHLLGKR